MTGFRIARQLGWVLWLLDAAVIVAGIIMFARVPGGMRMARCWATL